MSKHDGLLFLVGFAVVVVVVVSMAVVKVVIVLEVVAIIKETV